MQALVLANQFDAVGLSAPLNWREVRDDALKQVVAQHVGVAVEDVSDTAALPAPVFRVAVAVYQIDLAQERVNKGALSLAVAYT
jgi:hypothetical protein